MKKISLLLCFLMVISFTPIFAETVTDDSKKLETININLASLTEMANIGISKKISEKIIAFRKLIGAFKNKKDLSVIKGIGKGTLKKIIKKINFGDKKSVKICETSYVIEDIIKASKLLKYKPNLKVNINTANPSELSTLPKVGEGISKKIIDYRVKNGAFKVPEDICKVSGISKKKYKKLKKFIEVGDGKTIRKMEDFKDTDVKKLLSEKSNKMDRSFVGDGKLHIYIVDVNQGDSFLIITPTGYTILIDAGNRSYGQKTVTPFLKKMGINKINYMIVTHAHTDHLGGILKVIKKFKIDKIYEPGYPATTQTYKKFLKSIQRLGISYNLGRDKTKLELEDNINFSFLHPDKTFLAYGTHSDENMNSSVSKLKFGNFSMLFTGDIESGSEERLLKFHKKGLKSTILKAPHHGGKFSSTPPFLKAVSPEVVIISVGYKNMFSHPNIETIERYKKLGAKIYRTDESGTLHIESDGKSYNIVEEFKDGSKSHKNSKKKGDLFKEKININKANLKGLQKIPLVGIRTAEKILEYREKNGPYKSVNGIKKVRGIGTKLFKRIKKYMVIK